ncbi:MAG: hypothetical protein JXJ17_18300 [Anaerolineae bacterium]|nr:hypothetical protein [Anaerolineae bacterium]
MLDALDKIDWENTGYHVYGQQELIPDRFRSLLSPNPETRELARGFLLGSQQDAGDIYDTTPAIIPFLIELVTQEDTPDREELLRDLSGPLEYIYFQRYTKPLSLHMMQLCLNTYGAYKKGIDSLVDMLANEEKPIQISCIHLLRYMTDEVEYLIPELITHFRRESEEEVQTALLGCLKTLFSSLERTRYSLKEAYSSFFKALVESHPSHKVRVAAARASVDTLNPVSTTQETDRLSSLVPGILAREFWDRCCPMLAYEQEESYHRQQIVRDLSFLQPGYLIDLLRSPDLTTRDAHLVVRGLLAHTFLPPEQRRLHWHMDGYPRLDNSKFIEEYPVTRHLKAPTAGQKERTVLQAIVNANIVWENPTNLFSYFYGLPDSREELRDLLTILMR